MASRAVESAVNDIKPRQDRVNIMFFNMFNKKLAYAILITYQAVMVILTMDGRIIKFMILCLCVSLTGCLSSHSYTPSNTQRLAKPDQKQLQQLKKAKAIFAFSPNTPKIHETLYKKRNYETHQISFLKFHSAGDNGQPNDIVHAIFYRSKLPGKHKLVIILPIWGQSSYPPRVIAADLFRHTKGQVNVIRLLGKTPILEIEDIEQAPTVKELRRQLKLLALRTRNTVINVERLVNWAAKQKDTSPKSITIVGFSKSSIIAGLVAQIDPKVTGVILLMGGSDTADMLFNCKYYDVREKITKRFNWSDKKLLSVIHSYLGPLYNIASYPVRLDPCRVLIFESGKDTCVTKKSKENLWLGLGKPELISFNYDHQMSFAAMTLAGGYFIRRKIRSFLYRNNCPIPHSSGHS